MKRIILPIMTTLLLVSIVSCKPSTTKVENAQEKLKDAKESVIDAKKELSQAVKDSVQQWRAFYENQLIKNEKQFIVFKENRNNQKKENQIIYDQKIAEMENQNNLLKLKLQKFELQEETKWESFKREFNNDMDELGKAMKGFVNSDKK